MRNAIFLTALLFTAPAAAQAPVGVYFRWAAFEQANPRHCYAIAVPDGHMKPSRTGPYASLGLWPERRLGPQFYLRLSGRKRTGSAVILRIDGKPFQLVGNGADAWAPNPRADAAILAEMRRGVNMAVETRAEGGGRIRDRYVLRGAASAIDAAAFACAAGEPRSAGKKPQ